MTLKKVTPRPQTVMHAGAKDTAHTHFFSRCSLLDLRDISTRNRHRCNVSKWRGNHHHDALVDFFCVLVLYLISGIHHANWTIIISPATLCDVCVPYATLVHNRNLRGMIVSVGRLLRWCRFVGTSLFGKQPCDQRASAVNAATTRTRLRLVVVVVVVASSDHNAVGCFRELRLVSTARMMLCVYAEQTHKPTPHHTTAQICARTRENINGPETAGQNEKDTATLLGEVDFFDLYVALLKKSNHFNNR